MTDVDPQSAASWLGPAMALGSAFVWGFSIILFKRSEALSPSAINLGKNVAAVGFVGFTALAMGWDGSWHGDWDVWQRLIVSGILGIGIADTLVFVGLRELGASRMAVVECCYAPFVATAGVFLLGETLGGAFFLGGALVVLGVYVIARRQAEDAGDQASVGNTTKGVIAGILAMATMAFGVVYAKPALAKMPLMEATLVRLVVAVIAQLALTAVWPRARIALQVFKPSPAWKTLLPASFLGTYVAMVFWLGGFKYTDAATAGVLNQTTTVWTVLLAAVFLGERLTRSRLLGTALALGGAIVLLLG